MALEDKIKEQDAIISFKEHEFRKAVEQIQYLNENKQYYVEQNRILSH